MQLVTVTVMVAGSVLQPFAIVPMTVYVDVVEGLTVIDEVVSLFGYQ